MCVWCSQDACMPDVCMMFTKNMSCIRDRSCLVCVWCSQDACMPDVCTMFTKNIMSCIRDRSCLMCVWCSQDACMPDVCVRCSQDACMPDALWRAKKSHFHASDEMRMKTSIRFFNNDKRHYFVIWMHYNSLKWTLASIVMHPDNKIVSFVGIKESYRRFHTHFIRGVKVRLFCSPQCWKCDFFVRHNVRCMSDVCSMFTRCMHAWCVYEVHKNIMECIPAVGN